MDFLIVGNFLGDVSVFSSRTVESENVLGLSHFVLIVYVFMSLFNVIGAVTSKFLDATTRWCTDMQFTAGAI